jgi:hypothetical protein
MGMLGYRCGKLVQALVMGCAVASCAPSLQQEFAVTGAPPAPANTPFRNSDPNINDVEARAYCADGYEKISSESRPTDSGTIDQWRVRCTPYSVDFLPF